ncbi:MAG: LAGLIDADG family homing endonuclease, partial [Candidatus ainarchaeum sp.]|nr:LAGLIDADG family homing endonuclease [Candidatus ainarchaeum sp.]
GEDVDEELFSEQSESNELIEDLEVALSVKREDFNLTTDRKGVVAGRLKIRDRFAGEETLIDGTKMGRSGWMVPSDVDNGMELVDVDAKYVLVVEKDALWQRLNEDQFWRKENCIIITPKGQASRGTRRLIRKLADKGLPVYAFSVDAHEPIIVSDSEGMIRNEMIGELVDKQMHTYGSAKTGFFEKTAVFDYHALELEGNKVVMGNVLSALKHRALDKLYEISTEPGYSVKTTGAHSVMVFEDYEIKAKPVERLKKGDLLISSLNVPNNESVEKIDLVKLIKECKLEESISVVDDKFKRRIERVGAIGLSEVNESLIPPDAMLRYGKSVIRLKREIKLTPSLARLLGYFVAEGSSYMDAQFTFGLKETEYVEDVKKCIKECFGIEAHAHICRQSSVQIRAGGQLLALLFEQLLGCGKYAENKRIPYLIFNAPKEAKYEFLRGYFRGDGGVAITKKGVRLWACTVSRGLASDLVLLLLQLGCWATVEKKKGKGNELEKYHVLMYNMESLKKLEGIVLDIEPEMKERLKAEIAKSPVYKSIPASLLKPVQKLIYRSTGKGISDLFSQKTVNHEKLKKLLPKDFGSILKKDRILEYTFLNSMRSTAEIARANGVKFITAFKTLKRAETLGFTKSIKRKGKRLWEVPNDPRTSEEELKKLRSVLDLVEGGVVLLPVKKIGRVESSNGYAYDIETNPSHTFFGGVGPLLLHNTDCDAWGWYIYWTIKTGSMNLAYLGRNFAIPEMRFIGVTMKDIEDYAFLQKLTINAKEVDLKRAEEMLSYPWINTHKQWVEELKRVLKTKKKLEQDALQGQKLTFVGDYVRKKINERDLLP